MHHHSDNNKVDPKWTRNGHGAWHTQKRGSPWTLGWTPEPQTPNPKPWNPNPSPQTPNPKPQNPHLWTLSGPFCWTLQRPIETRPATPSHKHVCVVCLVVVVVCVWGGGRGRTPPLDLGPSDPGTRRGVVGGGRGGGVSKGGGGLPRAFEAPSHTFHPHEGLTKPPFQPFDPSPPPPTLPFRRKKRHFVRKNENYPKITTICDTWFTLSLIILGKLLTQENSTFFFLVIVHKNMWKSFCSQQKLKLCKEVELVLIIWKK